MNTPFPFNFKSERLTIGSLREDMTIDVHAQDASTFSEFIFQAADHAYRLAWVFGTDDRTITKTFGVHAVLIPRESQFPTLLVRVALPEDTPQYPSLTRKLIAANWYERYMSDMFGIIPEGHPDPRRLVHHENVPRGVHPLRKDFAWNTRMQYAHEPYPMQKVEGEGVYQIPVGPIHAGIIEPGHFRFSVVGERILNLESKLFFTHKGVEKLLEGKSPEEAMPYIERISDDSAVGHALTFSLAIESLTRAKVPQRAAYLRVLLAELERLTMHIHDIANIAGMGTGYTIMAAQGFRIKEELVRLSDRVFQNRFWRGYVCIGGVARDLSISEIEDIRTTVKKVMDDMRALLHIGLESDGLIERMANSGVLKQDAALAYGAVGVAARAARIPWDVRIDRPYAAYKNMDVVAATKSAGDVYARFMVRAAEIEISARLITHSLDAIRNTPEAVRIPVTLSPGESYASVEGWRGEILHFLRLNPDGTIDRAAFRDPSFANWPLFGELAPGNIVPDFPLCNKSLNLSYSGTDL